MTSTRQNRNWFLGISLRAATTALALTIVWLAVFVRQSAQAQTFNVIHNFTGGQDGSIPQAGLAMDKAGNIYGTASAGGGGSCNGFASGCGTVFKLALKGSGWVFSPLYNFAGGNDGAVPYLGTLTVGTDGSLYGTTVAGGGGSCNVFGVAGCGTVFNLRPSPTACKTALCFWTETVLYRFTNSGDGGAPTGGPVSDGAGNLYGTAAGTYVNDNGNVWKLTRSGGSWTHSIAYAFSGSDGLYPFGQLIFDKAGNIYGTTLQGGNNNQLTGTVYQLTPSGSGWSEKVIYNFSGSDGNLPFAGVIVDAQGNLYGATAAGGASGACTYPYKSSGTTFQLTPSGGSWNFNLLHSFCSLGNPFGGPINDLVMDSSGNLYGTTQSGGAYGEGSAFKLTPTGGGTWTYTTLHDFTGGSDGANPYSNVLFDAKGNLYGTASGGGASNVGVVWEVTP